MPGSRRFAAGRRRGRGGRAGRSSERAGERAREWANPMEGLVQWKELTFV